MDDMCYDRRRAEACVDESARHALANAGGREIVGKKAPASAINGVSGQLTLVIAASLAVTTTLVLSFRG